MSALALKTGSASRFRSMSVGSTAPSMSGRIVGIVVEKGSAPKSKYQTSPTGSGAEMRVVAQEPGWIAYISKLWGLRSLSFTPDAAGCAPSRDVVLEAVRFVWQLKPANLKPAQIAPSVVGGVGITIRNGRKKAYVEFNNKGNVNVLLSDGESKPTVYRAEKDSAGFAILISEVDRYLNG